MAEQPKTEQSKVGRCMRRNWVEERAVADLGTPDTPETKSQIQKHGHKGILMMDREAKMESVTTVQATYTPPKSPGVKVRGIRSDLFGKRIAALMRDKDEAEENQPIAETDFTTTSHRQFAVEGFVPFTPETTQVHDYKTDQTISYWSDNYHQIQGMTDVQNLKAPFRKSSLFSTPISERLDEIELPPDN